MPSNSLNVSFTYSGCSTTYSSTYLTTFSQPENLSLHYAYSTVQLVSNFTLKYKCSREPRRIFKSAHELLASARASLEERLRVLTSYLHVHDHCTSAKYS